MISIGEIELDLQPGEDVVALVSLVRAPGGGLRGQHHPVIDADQVGVPAALRWIADAIELAALPTTNPTR